jgi:hypothetical protein
MPQTEQPGRPAPIPLTVLTGFLNGFRSLSRSRFPLSPARGEGISRHRSVRLGNDSEGDR